MTTKTGSMARLECAASGHPAPQIGWQKDGGTDFPAAQERRVHVMPTDDVFFIVNVKPVDSGIYSCTAQNIAGIVVANATLTVVGKASESILSLDLNYLLNVVYDRNSLLCSLCRGKS